MDETKKLLWLLMSVVNTLERRYPNSGELVSKAQDLLQSTSIKVDPEMSVPEPRILLTVGDFKLPKEVADRA